MQAFIEGALTSLSRFDLIDALDILIISVMIYYLLKLASRSRAMQVLKGIGLVFVISRLTEWLRLQAVTWVFNYLINAGALVLIVLFQPEIRRGTGADRPRQDLRFAAKPAGHGDKRRIDPRNAEYV